MAHLKIGEKEYKADVTFEFAEKAVERYQQKDEKGNVQADGVQNIYMNILDRKTLYLAYFWDCALAYIEGQPSLKQIKTALKEAAGDNQDYEPLFKEAFQELDNAGFFKQEIKGIWKMVEQYTKMAETEQEQKMAKDEIDRMKKARKELNS